MLKQSSNSEKQKKSSLPWGRQSLMKLQPSETFVVRLSDASERQAAIDFITYADTLIGMNLAYDILMLRVLPDFREVLQGPESHTILELQIFNYLQTEVRPERSLKPLGVLLATHEYKRTLKDGRFKDENDPELHAYNGADTVNPIVDIAELSCRIAAEFPETDKLSPFCIQYFSDTIWSGIRMSEAGIPMSHSRLLSLQTRLEKEMADLVIQCKEKHDLIIKGKGRDKGPNSRLEFIDKIIDAVPLKVWPGARQPHNPLLQHELLERTDKRDDISWSIINRALFKGHLPDDHPLQEPLDLASRYSKAEKLVTSYTRTLLDRHHRPNKSPFSDILIPQGLSPCLQTRLLTTASLPPKPVKKPDISDSSSKSSAVKKISTWSLPPKNGGSKSPPSDPKTLTSQATSPNQKNPPTTPTTSPARQPETTTTTPLPKEKTFPSMQTPWTHQGRNLDSWLAYPSWYVVPSPFADMSSDEGGQQQARMSVKEPAAQTFPKPIRECFQSRWKEGCIVKMDFSLHELRIAALLSGDEYLVKALADGIDLHDDRAIQMCGPDVILRDDKGERSSESSCAKHVNFTDLNAGGAGVVQSTILRRAGIFKELSWCEEVVNARPIQRPGLVAWQLQIVRDACELGYYALPETGHSRYFLGGYQAKPNEIINFPIQGTAAIVLLCTVHHLQSNFLPPLNDPDPDCYLFLNRYDELDLDCRTPERAQHYADCIGKSVHYVATEGYWARMQERYGRKVPIVHKITIGDPTP